MSSSTEKTSEQIPGFSLPSSTGQTLTLESFLGKVPLVLIFMEELGSEEDLGTITEFNDRLREFGELRCQVLAFVKATAKEVRSYAEEHRLNLPILADASGSTIRSYGAEGQAGKACRLAVIADAEGRIVRRLDPGPPGALVDRALQTVDERVSTPSRTGNSQAED